MIIAIDGPAGAGKGTLAKRLAGHYGFKYLDSGALYRAVGVTMLQNSQNPEDADAATEAAQNLRFDFRQVEDTSFRAFIGDTDVTDTIRTQEAGDAASKVSAVPGVRQALKDFQVDFATTWGTATGAVLDGRDIGTVICPDADIKFFLDASAEIRAERRHKELQNKGHNAIYADVLAEIRERDDRDRNRSDAPLKPADDAKVVDTGDMSLDDVFNMAREEIDARSREAAS